ncbi:MAG: lysylphosphatidylglycerol synthase transmembrane domain-containing protein [Pirellulales bacterium]
MENILTKQAFPSRRKYTLLAIKIIASMALCGWIVTHTDWQQLGSVLRKSDARLIFLSFLLVCLSLPISAYKWQQLLLIHGLQYGWYKLQRWYLVATFLNHFLPTSIGGDGYRIYKTINNPKGKTCALLAVFVERLSGFMALLLLGYVAAIITFANQGDDLSGTIVMAGSIGIVAGIVGLFVILRWRLIQRLITSRFCPKPMQILVHLGADFRKHPRQMVLIGLTSFIFHINRIFFIWLLVYSLGTESNISELTIAVVAVEVIGLLPISLGGLGLVEGSFMYLMGYYGLNHETGLSAMLMLRGLVLPMSMLGGYFYFMGDREGNSDVTDRLSQ